MDAQSECGSDVSPAAQGQGNWLGNARQFCRHTISLFPSRLRWAILGSVVLVIGLFFYSSSHSATLRVTGRHAFRNVGLSVAVDGQPAFSDQIAGTTKKRYGVLSRTEGSFSRTLDLAPGEHTIAVRVISAADRFDQTRQCAVKVASGQESTLVVSASRSGMSVQFQGGGVNPVAPSPVVGYVSYLRSILLTMGGSALSAAIAFLVQDFLHSRKTQVPARTQSSQAS